MGYAFEKLSQEPSKLTDRVDGGVFLSEVSANHQKDYVFCLTQGMS
jgi:hypothetical protein